MNTALQTEHLTIGYTTSGKRPVVVARGLDLTLTQGELVCLLGPNGAGKSTLMRTLAGMQPPLGGRVRINGDDVSALKPRELAARLSVVLTDRPNIGLMNGYALVALGRHPYTDWTGRLSRYDEAVVHWAVESVGALDVAERPVMELSDGQRQKLMIARALAQESQVILLDEPTAYLDLPRRVEIMHLLRQLAAHTQRAVLLSTHDLDLALRSADTLWLMSGGRVRVGTPEDLVLNGAFEDTFGSAGVTFDRASGAFNVVQTGGKLIGVVGQGAAHTWTCRALVRAGFTLAAEGVLTPVYVTVQEDAPRVVWHLHRDKTHTTHGSIGALLAALKA